MALDASRQRSTDEAETSSGETSSGSATSRRAVLRAAGVGGAVTVAGLTAAACGGAWNLNSSIGDQTPLAAMTHSGNDAASPTATPDGTPVASVADVPLDSGKIIPDDGGTVITQPSAGTYKAFTATCTHQGCTVGAVVNNQIQCPCHGSIFSAQDGSVLQGPASTPLAAKPIAVFGDQIYLTAGAATGAPVAPASASTGNNG